MKKVLIVGMMLGGTLGVFAQGQLDFNNDKVNQVVTHVYSPEANGISLQGNSSFGYNAGVTGGRSGDFPTGTVTYHGVLLGGDTTGGTTATAFGNGNNWDAALYAAPGDNAVGALSLVPGSLTTFKTTLSGSGNGGWVTAPAPDPGIPGTAQGGSATVQMRAWYNAGGTINDYATALTQGVPAGASASFNVDNLGGTTVTPPELLGLTSFSLGTGSVPEPSTIAMGVMGVCAFLIRRRK